METVKWFVIGFVVALLILLVIGGISKIETKYTDDVWVPENATQISGYFSGGEGGIELTFEEFKNKSETGEILPTLMFVAFDLTTEPNAPKGAYVVYFAKGTSDKTFFAKKGYNFLTYRIPDGITLSCGHEYLIPPF